MTPHRVQDPCDWQAILGLMQRSFAYMEGRIDPPSSLNGLRAGDLAAMAQQGEVWVTGAPPVACMVLTTKPGRLYLGKLAVDGGHLRRGLARDLIALAEKRAAALGLPVLELQTRIELVENHAIFTRLGFVETGRSAHPGYDHPTTLSFQKAVGVRP